MLTDWEQRQIAEIERGLAADFTRRRRVRRRIGSIGWTGAAGTLLFVLCFPVLLAVRAWGVAAALAVLYVLALTLGARPRRGARRRSRPRA